MSKKEEALIQNKINEYIYSVNTEKKNAIIKSDYIVKNSYTLKLLDNKNPSNYQMLAIATSLSEFLETINNNHNNLLNIYSSNENLFENKYINHIDSLKNQDEITKNLKANENMYFSENINYDNLGNPYFTLYRNIFLDTINILEIKAYLPGLSNEDFSIDIKPVSPEYKNRHKYITAPINKNYIAVSSLNTKKLIKKQLFCIFICLIAAIIYTFMIIYITITINKKTTYTINTFIENLAKNDILDIEDNVKPDISDNLELKVIKNTIYSLIKKVKLSSELQYKTELEKKSLQLNLLQSKINPHVLYNSLAVISHKAYCNHDKTTFEIIDNLVSYYRLVLAKGKEITTISDEIKLIEKFVLVNEISHSKKYNLTTNIQPGMEEEKIIHLALQPFVENSIAHGLSGRHEDCIIKINCYKENGYSVFKIFDNGYGMSAEKLDELNNINTLENSYGIKNSFNRIRLAYGEDSSISFNSKEGFYTEVTIRLPNVEI